jgi:tRNA/tmRNA/rRNA uracil-C5-methylase (TrmA/RlmC/RlmD family)
MIVQADRITPPQGDSMLPLERSKLQKEEKINNRIKIYKTVSTRYLKTFSSATSTNDFESVPPTLQVWMSLLTESLQDIDANVERKKKSKALIDYEIHLRKSINEIKDYKVKAPLEQQDFLDNWVAQAEKIQAKFLDILFLGK